ncbi:MAG: hypothetical protein IKG42_03360 [Clostridia bacterium]|nr:hypothetical protein [Clostridia bacterium]
MDKLTNEFKNSLIYNAGDTLTDYLEVGIDNFIEDGVLREIPIVKSIVSGLRIAKNIYDRNLLKQTITFLNELNNGTISKDRLIAYKTTIENNPQKCEDELGRVLLYLNSFMDKEKSIMLAKIFKAYIRQEIKWNEFCEYSEIISRFFIQDIETLKKIYIDNIIIIDEFDNKYRLDRVASLGLINLYSKSKFSFGEEILDDFTIAKTEISEKFVNIIFN